MVKVKNKDGRSSTGEGLLIGVNICILGQNNV